MTTDFTALLTAIDAAVRPDDEPAAITARVKAGLEQLIQRGAVPLPGRFRQPRPDGYARRLLHRDPAGRYTVVVMTWGAGQGTPLHDHAGIWCVEGVVQGCMTVRQFDLVGDEGGACRFVEKGAVAAAVGSAGCLIPPFEYHTLANARSEETSVTLHVYGGEMDHCHIFAPRPDGSYERQRRALSYTD
ncbi:MAG TPA: cysteine dioxygenase family protein [Vicinamibacterales bacterium]|nr:cysteine dioxygenase family protein [Vicinamibacterales bacterium]